MSLSNIGLKRQIKDFFGIGQKDYTTDDLKKKQARCDELFDDTKDWFVLSANPPLNISTMQKSCA